MKMKNRGKSGKKQFCSALVVAMLTLSLLMVAFTAPATADPGWLSWWSYRKDVTISGSSSALSNHQVLVTVNTASLISESKMASDGSDIRFTDSDGTTLLNYWIEDGINTGSTKIWAEVSSIPTSGTTIYMYYGNSGASSASNGAATFEFFDDFDDLDGWSDVLFFGSIDHSTSSIVNNKLHIEVTDDGNRVGTCTDSGILSKNQRVEAKVDGRTGTGDINTVIFHSSENLYENDPCVSGDYEVWKMYSGAGLNLYDNVNEDDVPTYPYTEYRSNDYLYFGTREQTNRANIVSNWVNHNYRWGIYSYHAGTIEIDWVFVRKYASPEPGATIGSEETPSSPSSPSGPSAISSTGSFTLENSDPAVTNFTLYDANETVTITEMTPQIEYALKIDVADANKLTDILEIDVILKKHGILSTDSDSVTDKATYRWTPSAGWGFVDPAGSTWDINVSACKQPPSLSTTTGTWWLHFVPGKVARESDWDIYVKVTDMQSTMTGNIKEIYGMLWYGEISTVDSSYSFGDVDLGDEDKTITDPDMAVNVTTIANGNYTLKSKSENWVNDTYGSTATLDGDGTLDASHFALKVDAAKTVDSFNYVNTSYITITDFSSVTGPTLEDGENKGIYQWLCVASSGLLPGTYGGTYFVQIANG